MSAMLRAMRQQLQRTKERKGRVRDTERGRGGEGDCGTETSSRTQFVCIAADAAVSRPQLQIFPTFVHICGQIGCICIQIKQ